MSREGTIPFNKEETMKLYHTETQEDYNALMIELEKRVTSGMKLKKLPKTIRGMYLKIILL